MPQGRFCVIVSAQERGRHRRRARTRIGGHLMAANENDGQLIPHAAQKLSELRRILTEARSSADAERIHATLITVVDGLISHVERHARIINDISSDMTHKQGIVTKIDGGTY
jgi:hypothetical protein